MEWEERSQEPNAVFFGSLVMEAVGRRSWRLFFTAA
jgi:hypothetical protein